MTAPVVPPEAYRPLQDRITAATVAAVIEILRLIPIGIPLTDPQWQDIVGVLYPRIIRGRELGVQLAKGQYANQSPRGTAPPLEVPYYDIDALDQQLTKFVREPIRIAETHDQAIINGTSAMARHVEMAPRDYIRQATNNDNGAIGWARRARGDKTCAFCLMLISRGVVYKDGRTAGRNEDGTMNRWHYNCDCVAVPVFDLDDWPGRDQFLKAEKLWEEQADSSLKKFRQAVESGRPTESPQEGKK